MFRITQYIGGAGAWPLTALVALVGCATVHPQRDYERVGGHVIEATGQARVYQPEDDERMAGRIPTLVEELFQDGITAAEAVQVSLLNNPSLQAAFMDIGMARADVVQAGMLSNPFLGISARLPSGGGLANIEAGIAQNIAELWRIPVRERAARGSLDAAILDLASAAAGLAADAKSAYYAAVGADERFRIAQENLDVAGNLLDLALTRQQAGAANELDVNLSRGIALDANIKVERARLSAADARRALATLLGVVVDADAMVLADPLPDEIPQIADAQSLIELAKARRLDIRAAEQAVSLAEARLEEQQRLVWPVVELGLQIEREERRSGGGRDVLADTARASIAGGGLTAPEIQSRSERRKGRGRDVIIGPSLGIVLPIFDQNQAQIAKAQYALQQARKTLDAFDRAVTQEVRRAVDRTLTAWRLMQMYRDLSIPLAQSNLDLSREAFRAGRASFLSVLEAQRFFLETRIGYVEASQSAAMMIPELERTIGLPFDRFLAEVKSRTEPDQNAQQDHGP